MLLNDSDLRKRLLQSTDLSEEKIDSFINKTQEFFSLLESDIETTNHTEILEITSLLITFSDLFIDNTKWEELIYRSIKKTQSHLQNIDYYPIYAYAGLGQVAFTLNQLYLKLPSIKPLLVSVNELLCINIKKYIKTVCISEFSNANIFEFIYGLSGPLRHTLDFEQDKNMYEISTTIIGALINMSKEKVMKGHRVPGWFYIPSMNELKRLPKSAKEGIFNYSLSHGVAGPLVALSLAYKKRTHVDGLQNVIESIIREYLHSSYFINSIIYWPGVVTLEQYVGNETIQKKKREMSWCYGSIGILRALYLSSVYTSNKKLELLALSELEKIARLNCEDFLLHSPIVCHGFASVVSIMTEMYIDTGNTLFINMAQKHLECCIDYIINIEFHTIEKESDGKVKLYCYLEGISGILQTIYSYLFLKENTHKKRILIV